MSRAHFIFTKHPNSFSVHVKNLSELSVGQIQEIESFVKLRKGVFDFNKYSFSIQKKINFEEFEKLVTESTINAKCIEHITEEKGQSRVGFGQYKGMLFSDLPDSYMIWLKNNYRGQDRESIDKELSRRNL